ncbi:hypothetical protein PJN17_29550, partial [Mycobacterium kansasii]
NAIEHWLETIRTHPTYWWIYTSGSPTWVQCEDPILASLFLLFSMSASIIQKEKVDIKFKIQQKKDS